MEMLCCSPRSASSLLERAGLFPRTDEEYELRVIVWEARAVAIEPPKARLPQWTQRSAPPSSTRLRLRMHRRIKACPTATRARRACASARRLGSTWRSACSRVARYRPTTCCSRPTTARATPKATPSSTGACGGPCRQWRRRRRCTLRWATHTGPMTRWVHNMYSPRPRPHPTQSTHKLSL